MRAFPLVLVACAPAAAAPDPVTDIHPVALAGPFKSLAEACKAAHPCGFTDLAPDGMTTIKPPKRPSCDVVLDPGNDVIAQVPASMTKTGGAAKLTHKTGDAEIRIGGVRCAVPQGLREDHSEYYVFVKRGEGWWRTQAPMFEYDYNNKYCAGGLYVGWNDKPTRTIAGIAAMGGCLTCGKQGNAESIVELMLRVETGGQQPAVFPFLPVGTRKNVEMYPDPGSPPTDPECKPSKSAMSLKETWPNDDEVILEGAGGSFASTELKVDQVVGNGSPTAGHYRFRR